MADFEAEIDLNLGTARTRTTRERRGGAGGSAFAGGLAGGLLGGLLSSVKALFEPLSAIANLLVLSLFPILKPFLILFIKVGLMLFKFLQRALGGEAGPAAAITGTAGLTDEQINQIKETGKKLGLSEQEIQANIDKANELEKKKNKVMGILGTVLGAIIGIGATIIAGFTGIPAIIGAAIVGAFLGLITIIFGRDVADNVISFMKESFEFIKEAFMNFPRNIKAFAENLKNLFTESWKNLKEILSLSWNNLTNQFTESWTSLKEILGGVWENLKNVFSKSFEVLSGLGSFIKNKIKSFIGFGGGGMTTSVDDAIITPSGDIIRTNPNDFLIATKTPEAFSGNGGGAKQVNVSINGGLITEDVARDIGRILQRELNFGGGF